MLINYWYEKYCTRVIVFHVLQIIFSKIEIVKVYDNTSNAEKIITGVIRISFTKVMHASHKRPNSYA